MMHEGMRFRLRGLLAETGNLIARSWWRIVIGFVVMTAVAIVMDLKADDRSANLLFTVVALIFQIWLTTALLDELGKRKSVSAGSGTVIGVLLISQIGILLGLLLLVVPGVIAFVRWSMVVPIVLSDRRGSGAALTESWNRTKGHFWPILGLFTVIYAPIFVVAAGVEIFAPTSLSVVPLVLFDGVASLALIVGWHAAIALFLASESAVPSPHELVA
jgi:hypothetical protein